jgi:membrane protein required for colicin V production
MQIYDIVMIAVLVLAVVFGAWKGLAWQVASLASLVVSYFLALRFSTQLAPYISDREPLNRFVAMLLIYMVTGIVIWLLFRLVAGFMDRLKLKEFDRQMGALVGLAKGGLLCIAITFFAVSLTEDPYRQSILTSHSGHYIGYVLDRAQVVMPEEIHGVLEPYLDELDSQLEHDHVEFDIHGQPIDNHAQDWPAPVTAEIPAGDNTRSR